MGSHESEPDADASAVLNAVRRLVRYLRLADREAEAATGLSAAQLFILYQLAAQPAGSLAELAQRTLTDPSSVSSVIDRLVRRGMVRRLRSREDARRAELRLTPIGQRVLRHAPGAPQERIANGVRAMTPDKRTEVARALEFLVAAIGADGTQARMLFEDEPTQPRRSRGAAARA